MDQILDSARVRPGLAQAQAGHASIKSTRIYLHLTDDWLASQYRRAWFSRP